VQRNNEIQMDEKLEK